MLRSMLIYLSKASWARQIVTRWQFAWRAASRFVAGERVEDAIRAIQSLNQRGISATLDLLGEHTTNAQEARQATDSIIAALDAIQQAGVTANVSVKLSQLGMNLDDDLCCQNLQRIVSHARQQGNFIRIDMEEASTTDKTLQLYVRMRQEYSLDNCGVVLQAYLHRTEADVRNLMTQAGRVRLCKGAYLESPAISFARKSDTDANYDHLAHLLMDGALTAGSPTVSPDGKIPPLPAIASHDPRRLMDAKSYAQQIGLPKAALEFQMLYGIRRDLQEQMVQEGYPVRVYVPYGSEWYPYFVRRLAERPANLWFFIYNFFQN
jgi:proline dehydrogenase